MCVRLSQKMTMTKSSLADEVAQRSNWNASRCGLAKMKNAADEKDEKL